MAKVQHHAGRHLWRKASELEKSEAVSSPYTTAVDWSPNAQQDPGNPQNWSWRKKSYHLAVPTAVAFLCPFGSSIYTPAISEVSRDFHVSREIALLPFVFYLLGLSFGPVIAGPASETFGRRIVYICALPLFAAFTLGAGFSQSIASLIVCRFFAGFVASPGLSLGSGTMADVLLPHRRAVPMAIFVCAVQIGPVLGPLIGGYVTEKLSWRWTQWVILFGLAFVLAITLPMQETYKGVILERRARKYNIPGPPQPVRTRMEAVRYFTTKTIVRPLHMLFTEPIAMAYDVYAAFAFGLLNAFFAAFSWVFETVYHFSLGVTGLTYLGQLVGTLAGVIIMVYISKVSFEREFVRLQKEDPAARLAPERKLIFAKIGAPLLPISLFWFGWTARSSVHWISPVMAEAVFSCAVVLIFTTSLMYLQDCYGAKYGASAASSNTFLRYLVAFAFPQFAIQMYEGLGVGWATSLLGFFAVLLMPIPFIFDRYGTQIRSRSKYAHDE